MSKIRFDYWRNMEKKYNTSELQNYSWALTAIKVDYLQEILRTCLQLQYYIFIHSILNDKFSHTLFNPFNKLIA